MNHAAAAQKILAGDLNRVYDAQDANPDDDSAWDAIWNPFRKHRIQGDTYIVEVNVDGHDGVTLRAPIDEVRNLASRLPSATVNHGDDSVAADPVVALWITDLLGSLCDDENVFPEDFWS